MTEQQPPCIFPALRFGNSNRMIDWLQEAFGFRLHACHKADDGSIAHAELALGTSMIMVGQSRDDAFSKIVGEPNGPGGKTLYVAVADVDTAFRRAETAGATIVEQLTERDYGSREFVCLDPEENVWCFGTYWPTAAAG